MKMKRELAEYIVLTGALCIVLFTMFWLATDDAPRTYEIELMRGE